MNKPLRESFNVNIHNIKVCKNLLTKCETTEEFDSPKAFDTKRDRLLEELEEAYDRLEGLAITTHARNLDKAIQKSVNYYLKKAGLKPLTITAYI
jgi:hypothetical protein